MKKSEDRIQALNSLRAFAAISVCLYHFVCTTTGYIQTKWILDAFSIGKYGVQLFFVISGFIIPWAMDKAGYRIKDFFTFLVKRLMRLEPPYIVSLIIAVLLLIARKFILGPSENLQEISTVRVLLHFGYLIPFFSEYNWINQVYWTLAIEFQYYIFIAILFIPLSKCGGFLRSIVYLMFFILSFVGNQDFLPYWLPVFLLGILVFLNRSNKIRKPEFYLVLLLNLTFCLWKYKLPEVFYMVIPVVVLLYNSEFENSVGNWIGSLSYSLYLMHPIVGATFINVLSHNVLHPVGKLFLILTGLMVSILASWLIYKFIERPSQRISSRIKY